MSEANGSSTTGNPPLGTELRDRRLERGWTQGDLAERVGAETGVAVSAWENNHHNPSESHAAKLVELFGESKRGLSLYERRQKH